MNLSLSPAQRFLAIALLITAGCASGNQSRSASVDEASLRPTQAESKASTEVNNQAALAADASFFTEIEFKPGSSELTPASRQAIQRVLAESQKMGELEDVKILAWSDEEFPSNDQKSLPTPAQRLADRRADAVSNYVETLDFKLDDVDTYNMARRPNFLQRWMKTSDARFKNAMVKAGLPTTADQRQYPSKASKAVILVTLED